MEIRSQYFSNLAAAGLYLAICLVPVKSLSGDSLWLRASNSEVSMFADKRAFKTGDILSIIVSESTSTVTSQDTKSTKSSSISNKVTQFLFTPANSGLGTHNGELPATDITGDNSFAGSGAITNSQTLSTRIAVTVIDVLPNGNLVVEGVRHVSFSGEKNYMILRGMVRRVDISPSNTVASTSVADLQVEVISEGSITSAQKKGWLTRINDKLNPF